MRFDREQVAWAAGLFEGEGWITARIYRGRLHVKLGLASTDRDTVDHFHAVVGVGSIREKIPNGLGHKPQWTWQAQNFQSFQHVLAVIWPWLGERRRGRATDALVMAADYRAMRAAA